MSDTNTSNLYTCGCPACVGQTHITNQAMVVGSDAPNYVKASVGHATHVDEWQSDKPIWNDHNLSADGKYYDQKTEFGNAITIKYTFNDVSWQNPFSRGNEKNLTTEQQTATKAAMDAWSSVANVKFILDNAHAQLTLHNYNLGEGVNAETVNWSNEKYFNDFFTGQQYVKGGITQSSIAISNSATAFTPNSGGYGYLTILHELGHTLGLKHTGDYNASGGTPVGPFLKDYKLTDTHDLTVMSYNDGKYSTSAHHADGPMLYDIAAMQYLYGANHNYKSGNDGYYINNNQTQVSTRWDGGGIDTLTTGGGIGDFTVDLREGENFITKVGKNISWNAFGANIENATTGAGKDTLYGNALNNVLTGGAGADTIDGGAGLDTVNYSTSGSGVNINLISGSISSGGDAAGDKLTSVENAIGSASNDSFIASSAANEINGGNGTDIVDYGSSTAGVNVNMATNVNTGGYANGDKLINVENIGGSSHNDTLAGSLSANNLNGGDGIDTLSYANSNAAVNANLATNSFSGGHAAGDKVSNMENLLGSNFDDSLAGSASANTIDGGNGIDTVNYINSTSAVNINLATNVNTGGNATGDKLLNIENVIGTDFNDTLAGGLAANTLFGDDGIDTVSYVNSNAAVNINLTSTVHSGGHAAGDKLSNIENIIGSTFNDTLVGSLVANSIDGGNGTDSVSYVHSNAAVNVNMATNINTGGHAVGDKLTNIENLTGSGFNDTLAGSLAANSIDGGNGIDTATYVSSNTAVNVNLTTNVNTGGHANGDLLKNIENVTGSNFNDWLTGSSSANVLDGGTGVDVVNYSASNAGVNIHLASNINTGGHAEGDKLFNIENIIGSTFNDTMVGKLDANNFNGNAGLDTAIYSNSNEAVTVDLTDDNKNSGGFAEGDVLTSIENLIGSNFNDTLKGDNIANNLNGNNGDDTLEGGLGADTLNGGGGSDSVSYKNSAAAVMVNLTTNVNTGAEAQGDVLIGIEKLIGSAFNDQLFGDSKANTINGGDGADTIDGMGGGDTVIYNASDSGVTVDLSNNANNKYGFAQGDVLINIENLVGSYYADKLTGNERNNSIGGGVGADTINGMDGIDTATYISSEVAVTVDLTNNANNKGGFAQGDVLLNIENLLGSTFNDRLVGNAENNMISGGAGADTILGNDGDDSIYGGGDADNINGGNGMDTVNYGGSAAIIVNLSNNTENAGGFAEGDVLTSIENIVGTSFDDKITGSVGNNSIGGGLGADTIDGMDGDDTATYVSSNEAVTVNLANSSLNSGGFAEGDLLKNIENIVGSSFDDKLTGNQLDNRIGGGIGADTIEGMGGEDTATYISSNAGVTVDLSNSANNSGGYAQGDVLTSIENIIGSMFNDKLTGSWVDNILTGGEGNDTLFGGAGNDKLLGGVGSDLFLASTNGGIDEIFDFTNGSDKISANGKYDIAATISNAWQVGSDTHIKINGDELVLVGLNKNLLDNSDFLGFV